MQSSVIQPKTNSFLMFLSGLPVAKNPAPPPANGNSTQLEGREVALIPDNRKSPGGNASFVQGILSELHSLDATRTQLIQECKADQLDMCPCIETDRVQMETHFILEVLSRFPPNSNIELSILSLGSGDLLQDWILLKKLTKVGY